MERCERFKTSVEAYELNENGLCSICELAIETPPKNVTANDNDPASEKGG
jgi:hypothetical protein